MTDRSLQFREEARMRGLMLSPRDYNRRDVPKYYFDLNRGAILTIQDLSIVVEIAKLAKEYSHQYSGEYRELLDLVTRKLNLEKGKDIYWNRAYHVKELKSPKNKIYWISLDELLAEKGFEELY